MISIGISGATGRMGRFSQTVIASSDGLAVGGLYAPGHEGDELKGGLCSGDPEALRRCDVILELCPAGPLWDNLKMWRSFDSHVVVGSSGLDADQLAELALDWEGSGSRCLVVPNFSTGAVLMMRFAELAASHFAAVEIIELHHDRKRDAPSGTALNTASRIAQARRAAGLGPIDRGTELVPGALGAQVEEVPIHSVRAPGLISHQEVILSGEGESLTVRHDTLNLSSFAAGIILALRSVGDLEHPLTVGLDSLLAI